MHFGYLWELLEEDEQSCFEQLRTIQATQNHRETMPVVLRKALSMRESQLVRELSHLKRIRLATPVSKAIVALTKGGDA